MLHKLIFLFSIIFISLFISANTCYHYKVQGVIRYQESNFKLVINEKTKSETKLLPPLHFTPRLVAYRDRFVMAEILLNSKSIHPKSKIVNFISIKLNAPTPFAPSSDSHLQLLKVMDCDQ